MIIPGLVHRHTHGCLNGEFDEHVLMVIPIKIMDCKFGERVLMVIPIMDCKFGEHVLLVIPIMDCKFGEHILMVIPIKVLWIVSLVNTYSWSSLLKYYGL